MQFLFSTLITVLQTDIGSCLDFIIKPSGNRGLFYITFHCAMMSFIKISLVCILTVLIGCSVSSAQNQWGGGLIVESSLAKFSGSIPKIPLYKTKEGTGLIDSIYFDGQVFFGDSEKFTRDNNYLKPNFAFVRLECESQSLLFFSESKECVSVFMKSLNAIGWLKKEDLKKNGWEIISYVDFLALSKKACYPLASGNGLNLREGPGAQFNIVAKLSPLIKKEGKNVFEIQPEGIRSDNWLKVNVRQYNQSFCQDVMTETSLIATFKGWIKAVDDESAQPNIWFDLCCDFD